MMTNHRNAASAALSVLCVVALVALAVATLEGQVEQILVDDPRPIEKVTEAIGAHCRCVITYEDPRYTQQQLVDWTSKVRKDGKTEPTVWGPPQIMFGFNYDLGASDRGMDEVAGNVEFMLGQANSSRKDGVVFRLTRANGMMHVIPASGSILSTKVSGVLKEGKAFDVIRSIVNAVSRAQGTRIGIFGMHQLLNRTLVSLPSDSGTAEQLLTSLWPAISKDSTLSWKLLYEGGMHFYVLNIVPVPEAATRR